MSKNDGKFIECQHCGNMIYIPERVLGKTCSTCSKYNDSDYVKDALPWSSSDNNEVNAPNIIRANPDKLAYTQLRDESAIRADFFTHGKTRETMPPAKFRKELKRELIKNKCYRGKASNVD